MPLTNTDIQGTPEYKLKALYEELDASKAAYAKAKAERERKVKATWRTPKYIAAIALGSLSGMVVLLGSLWFFGSLAIGLLIDSWKIAAFPWSGPFFPYAFGVYLVSVLILIPCVYVERKMNPEYHPVMIPAGIRTEGAIKEDIQALLKRNPSLKTLNEELKAGLKAVTDRLARLDDYGKLELFSTCHNCAKWQEVLFADNEHCIKPKVAKSPPSRHPFRPGSRSVQLRDSDRSDVLMQGMISIEDNSKAAVGLLGALLQLSYIEQCILLDHIEEGMTFEDLVASLKSSASHEAKSIAKRIEALSEELNGSGEQDMANVAEEMGIKIPDIDRKSMVDADIEMVKQNVIMGISSTDHPDDPAWPPAIQAARLFEYAMYMLLDHADADSAQKAANEALDILKAHKPQIEQLHTLLEQEGSEDDR